MGMSDRWLRFDLLRYGHASASTLLSAEGVYGSITEFDRELVRNWASDLSVFSYEGRHTH